MIKSQNIFLLKREIKSKRTVKPGKISNAKTVSYTHLAMNVTESRFKNRQLHIEDYLQMVSAEQKEYAEVFDYSKITEKSGVITDYWTCLLYTS